MWREIDEGLANEAAITEWIIEGQFNHPLRVIAFNSGEGWSRDVTEDVARVLTMWTFVLYSMNYAKAARYEQAGTRAWLSRVRVCRAGHG